MHSSNKKQETFDVESILYFFIFHQCYYYDAYYPTKEGGGRGIFCFYDTKKRESSFLDCGKSNRYLTELTVQVVPHSQNSKTKPHTSGNRSLKPISICSGEENKK